MEPQPWPPEEVFTIDFRRLKKPKKLEAWEVYFDQTWRDATLEELR